MVPILIIAFTLSALINSLLGLPLKPMPLVSLVLDKDISIFVILFFAFEACIMAPLMEELLFRGLFFGTLRKYFSFTFSAIVSGLIFSALHEHFLSFIPITILALFFSHFYEKTRNLAYPIILHAMYNTCSLITLLIIKYTIN